MTTTKIPPPPLTKPPMPASNPASVPPRPPAYATVEHYGERITALEEKVDAILLRLGPAPRTTPGTEGLPGPAPGLIPEHPVEHSFSPSDQVVPPEATPKYQSDLRIHPAEDSHPEEG
jgi:hypothetical protein